MRMTGGWMTPKQYEKFSRVVNSKGFEVLTWVINIAVYVAIAGLIALVVFWR